MGLLSLAVPTVPRVTTRGARLGRLVVSSAVLGWRLLALLSSPRGCAAAGASAPFAVLALAPFVVGSLEAGAPPLAAVARAT